MQRSIGKPVFENGIPEHLDKTIRRTALRVNRSCRHLAEVDDLVSEVYLWMVKHERKMQEFLDPQDRGKTRQFATICYRRMQEYVARERMARTGGKASDQYYYHAGLIEELLPDVWSVEDRLATTFNDANPDSKRGRSMPSEGGNRHAMMADVIAAVQSLSEPEQDALRMRYDEGGMTLKELALVWEISEAQASRRMGKITERLIDYLGGESPWTA